MRWIEKTKTGIIQYNMNSHTYAIPISPSFQSKWILCHSIDWWIAKAAPVGCIERARMEWNLPRKYQLTLTFVFDNIPTSVGMLPSRWFSFSSNNSKFSRFPTSDGIGPVSWFSYCKILQNQRYKYIVLRQTSPPLISLDNLPKWERWTSSDRISKIKHDWN